MQVTKEALPSDSSRKKDTKYCYLTHQLFLTWFKIEGEITRGWLLYVSIQIILITIKKDETTISKLSDEEKETLKTSLETVIPKHIPYN
jgi:hypothetical protein